MSPAPARPDAAPATAPALVLRTASADDTRALGAALAGALRPGDVVLLLGDLGSGKTTLVQGAAGALGVTGDVTSPTFTLVRVHRCTPGPAPGGAAGVRTVLHADLYRLERRAEVADLGLGELVEEGGVALVEWGEAALEVLGPDVVVLTLEPGPEDRPDERRLTVSAGGALAPRAPELARRLAPWRSP